MSTALAEREISIEGGLIHIKNMSEAMSFATTIFQSGMCPTTIKNPSQVLIVLQHGAEVGLKPMQALRSIYVVNNRPTIFGEAVPGIVLNKGILEDYKRWYEGDGDNLTAICKTKRKGIAEESIGTFSVADAKRAGLIGKPGPWTLYPKDQLMWKAIARSFRPLFGDVLCGMPIYEDYREVPSERALTPPSAPDPLLTAVAGKVVPQDLGPTEPQAPNEGNRDPGPAGTIPPDVDIPPEEATVPAPPEPSCAIGAVKRHRTSKGTATITLDTGAEYTTQDKAASDFALAAGKSKNKIKIFYDHQNKITEILGA